MKLPQTTEVDELNRVLIAVAELTVQDEGCSTESVIALCSSFALRGRPANHRRTLELCSFARLISISGGWVNLTRTGRDFLDLNPSRSYELTDAQERFVADQLVLSGPWRGRARGVFQYFSPNYAEVTYEISLADHPLPSRFQPAIHLLRRLGVLVDGSGRLTVAPQYVASVVRLLASRRGTTEEDLINALQVNRSVGVQAEEAVASYERKRLSALGRHAEASLVRRISELDVAAGYDIESFDGDKPRVEYDRFIEAKGSQGSQLRFFWTLNERRAAERLGKRYWIYFIRDIGMEEVDHIVPIMIQDPAARLELIGGLRVQVSTYLVTQSADLTLKGIPEQDVPGLVL
jgi:hypothetical protein